MGLFSWIPRPFASASDVNRDASEDRWFVGAGAAMSEIDVAVTVARARQVPVISDCLALLAGSTAGLDHGVFRRVGNDQVERLGDHPVAALMQSPNDRMTSYDFVYHIVDDLCATGNFYARRVEGADGRLRSLERLDPDRVTLEEIEIGEKRYRHNTRFGTQEVLLQEEVWHIAMPPVKDNLVGRSPILDSGREAVAVAIALQRYANILFTNDATPPYWFTMDGNFKDEDSKKNFLKAVRKWATGRNRHQPGVGEYGMKPHRMGLTAEEAQFLETRKELWLDLTRLWRVPPHKVGIMDRATFSNIEHQALEFVTDTLRPLLELIERSVTKFLIATPGVYFEFNVESLLRGDIKARYEAYALGRQWGWLSVNDILRTERKNGIGSRGDVYLEPLNMVPVGTDAASRQPEARAAIEKSIAFLRESVSRNGGRPRLELVKDAA